VSTVPRVVTIVQARMGSTRLPGKVLQELHGRPLLERLIERLKRARSADAIVIATTTDGRDDAIAGLARELGVGVFRGDEHDVLARYAGAAAAHDADVVVRVTSDCPLLDPDLLDRCVQHLLEHPDLDYVSNALERTYPRGLDVEAIRRSALDAADRDATDGADREHVTRFVWRQPERFRLGSIRDDEDHSDLRWTVDTPEDLDVVRAIYDALYPVDPTFDYAAALRHAFDHPEVHDRNRHVVQKPV
jgi:spore coat polysaccharide biosynthesis protein SpsF